MLDGARPVNLAEGDNLAGINADGGRNLPTLAQLPRRFGARTLRRHAPLTLVAGEVLRTDRSRLGMG